MFSNKVNGHVISNSEALTGRTNFFTIITPVDIVNGTVMVNDAVSNVGADAYYGAPAGASLWVATAGATSANTAAVSMSTSNAVAAAKEAAIPDGPIQNTMTALDKLIEIVAQRGQPVIMGTPTPAVGGGGPYTFRFATEHYGSWNVTGTMLVDNSAIDLQQAIMSAGIDFGFDGNTTVLVSSNL